MKVRSFVAVVAAGFTLLSGCADSPSTTTEEGSEVPELTSGLVNVMTSDGQRKEEAIVTIADYGEARSLDPVVTASTGESGGTALAAIYDTLAYYDVETETYRPWLADTIESHDDSTRWVLGLRDDVRFSDGTPLDAKAVKRSIQRYIDESGPDAGLIEDSLQGMQVTAPDELVFTLRRSWASFPAMLAQGAGMVVAPRAGSGNDFEPIGAGPFTLEEYRPAESLTLKANPDYWGGEVGVAGLRFVWPNDDKARFDTLRGAEADVTILRSPQVVREALAKEWTGYLAIVNAGKALLINNRDGRPGSDINVRKSIADAIKPEVIDERAYGGGALPGERLFGAGSRWHAPPVAAQRSAAEGTGAEGVGRLTYVAADDPVSRVEAVTIQAQLKGIGLDVDIEWLSSSADVYQRVYLDHDFDLATAGISVTDEDPFHRLTNFMSSSSTRNVVGYSEPRADVLLDRLQAAPDDEARAEVLGELDALWQETSPAVVTAALPVFVTWQQTLQGVTPTAERMLLLGKAWVSDE